MSGREELGVAGLTEPISHFTDAVRDRAAVNEIRQERFGATRPASTLVEVSRLVLEGAFVEIEAVALLP